MNKKLLAVSLVVALAGMAYAAPGVRGAKGYKNITASATAIGVCLAPGGGALYSVVASTGAATDYIVFRDSNTANTTSTELIRIGQGVATLTNVTFDPPIQFKNGIVANAPATTGSVVWTYECGRVTQGN
jgi:hypothetical protein